MVSLYQARDIARKILNEYNVRPFDLTARIVEEAVNATPEKEDQVNLAELVRQCLADMGRGGLN
jgi:hypothetical protein